MITATFKQQPGDDNNFITIEIVGHAEDQTGACPSLCGIILAATEGIRRLAELYPNDVQVVDA